MQIIEGKNYIKIVADPDKRLTDKDRSFFKTYLYLGKNDSPENYEEVGSEIWGPILMSNNGVNTVTANATQANFSQENMMKEIIELRRLVYFLIDELVNDKNMTKAELNNKLEGINSKTELFELLDKYSNCIITLYKSLYEKGAIELKDIPEYYRRMI